MTKKLELSLVTDFTESKMYRSKQAFKNQTSREICDHAFMDMIAIWILINEFDYAADAIKYASRTSTYNNFNQFRQNSTDLYLNLHVIQEHRTDLLQSESDAVLLDKVTFNNNNVIRYLRTASANRLTSEMARQTLQRLEQSLYIENSNYRSVRRMAQSWQTLQTSQKRTILTRMLFFYKAHARRSEIYDLLTSLANSQNLVDQSATNPEHSTLKTAAAAGAAAAAGFAGGYHLGKNLV